MKVLKLSPPVTTRGGDVGLPANISNANVNAASNGAAAVTQIFDNKGDPI